jgi:RNA polymerase sigma-70 factor, ECF subfamily
VRDIDGTVVPPDEFTAMFDEHWPRVCAYVARRAPATAAEDVAAEVFAIAWRRHGELPRDVLPWLLRTAANLLRNQWRADARRADLPTRLGPAAPSRSTAETAAQRAEARAVMAALARLDDDQREVIMLIHWDGLSAAQAARVLGCSHVAARSRLMRARRALANALDEPVAEPELECVS